MLHGSLDERGVWGKMDTYISMAGSLRCPSETITTLLTGYTPIQRKKCCFFFFNPNIMFPQYSLDCESVSCLVMSNSLQLPCSLPGSSVHGILQIIRLEWVAISFSRGSSWPRDWTRVSCIADRFFTFWATWKAPNIPLLLLLLSRFSRVRLCATP